MASGDQVIELLRRLVRIESINPSLSPTGSGEGRVVEFLKQFCDERKLEYELQDVLEGRPNFFTWIPGLAPERRILFVAHMDTVPVDAWKSDPFAAELKEDTIYGRGTCDTKGALAAMLVALATLGERRPKATVVVAGTVDEEFRKAGARAIAHSGQRYDAAVVGEPTDLELVVAHKGSVRWQIEVLGVPAHSSKPHLGVNAIAGMAKVVLALQDLNAEFKARAHPLVGPPTLTVSLIEGGLEVTTVPPSCRIWVDRRLIPGERPQEALDEVERVLETLRSSNDGVKVRSILPALEDPAPASAESTWIAEAAAKACAAVAGTGSYRGVPYGSDASQLSLANIPCVVIGPGSIDQAHTSNEFVSIEQVHKAVEVYQEIMLSY